MTNETQAIQAKIGVVTTRVLVPLWLILGAVLKIIDGSPSHLPSVLIKYLGGAGIDLLFVLKFSIAIELIVAGVMILVPALARGVGLVMLGVFFPILVAELLTGASSCGCFGAVSVHPAITATTDGTFFLLVLLLGRKAPSLKMTGVLPLGRTLVAGIWMILAFAIAFGYSPAKPETSLGNNSGNNDSAVTVPEYYGPPNYEEWVGQNWSDVDIAPFVSALPEGFESGLRYVLFYRLDCEHCHELMEVFFTGPLSVPTLAVAIPMADGFPAEGVLPFPCDECSHAELPSGCSWFITTPVLVRLNEGTIECAAEVTAGNPECIEW